ncbi:hypothetical protein ABZW49_49140, partial [Nonomuraea wenchangensis]
MMTDRFGRALGWTSLALGTAQLAAPRAVTRLCGVDDAPGAKTIARLAGGRELLHAALLLGGKTPRRKSDCLCARAQVGWGSMAQLRTDR